MQIVIDIPEEIKSIIDKNGTNEIVTETLWQAIKNGTPLPKGHGRLIDASRLMRVDHIILESQVDNAPTVIDADKEVQE